MNYDSFAPAMDRAAAAASDRDHWVGIIVIDDDDLTFGGKPLSAWYEEDRRCSVGEESTASTTTATRSQSTNANAGSSTRSMASPSDDERRGRARDRVLKQ